MVREPAVAGAFYPADKEELEKMISKFLLHSRTIGIPGELKGLIVPHAGYIFSGIVAAAGYKMLKNLNYKKFLILGPSHYVPFFSAAFSPDEIWLTPFGKVSVIKPKETEILKCVPEAHFQEHSIEVQLPFLQTVVKQFEIIPLVLGDISPAELSKELINLIDDETFIIVSSDLSHYHSYADALRIDSIANETIPLVDIENARNVDACGIRGILTLLHVAKQLEWNGILIDYKNSGDITGDKEQVVGYGCYGFYKKRKAKHKGKEISH